MRFLFWNLCRAMSSMFYFVCLLSLLILNIHCQFLPLRTVVLSELTPIGSTVFDFSKKPVKFPNSVILEDADMVDFLSLEKNHLTTSKSIVDMVGRSVDVHLLNIVNATDGKSVTQRSIMFKLVVIPHNKVTRCAQRTYAANIFGGLLRHEVVPGFDDVGVVANHTSPVHYSLKHLSEHCDASTFYVEKLGENAIIRAGKSFEDDERFYCEFELMIRGLPEGNDDSCLLKLSLLPTTKSQLESLPPVFTADIIAEEVFSDLPIDTDVVDLMQYLRGCEFNSFSFEILSDHNSNSLFLPFHVDRDLGIISTGADLTKFADTSFDFDVKVSMASFASSVKVSLRIVETNIPIKLRKSSYRQRRDGQTNHRTITVLENATLEWSHVISIGGTVSHAPVASTRGRFEIDLTGRITLTKTLNYEKEEEDSENHTDSLVFTVRTSDSNPGLRSYDIPLITVNVDEKPRFTNKPIPMRVSVKPGDPVMRKEIFKFVARPEGGDVKSGKNIVYAQHGSIDKFIVHKKTGSVTVNRNFVGKFNRGDEFKVTVVATDNATNLDTDYEELTIVVTDQLEPQFEKASYTYHVPESADVEKSLYQLEAFIYIDGKPEPLTGISDRHKNRAKAVTMSFRSKQNEYNNDFTIDNDGVIMLTRKLDLEIVESLKSYSYVASVYDGPLKGNAEVVFKIVDANDQEPYFEVPVAYVDVLESTPIGTVIEDLEIKAIDLDINKLTNGRVVYKTNDTRFKVLDSGKLKIMGKLDADVNQKGQHSYIVKVYATDQAIRPEPRKSSHMILTVRVINANDEKPVFTGSRVTVGSQDDRTKISFKINERAEGGTVVGTIEAHDPDKDELTFSFKDTVPYAQRDWFVINAKSGVISVNSGKSGSLKDIMNGKADAHLVVIAEDDGSCCIPKTEIRHKSEADVHIMLLDENDHAPEFTNCAGFSEQAKMTEQFGDNPLSSNHHAIVNITATDKDQGVNAMITYEIEPTDNNVGPPFRIDRNLGLLYPLQNHRFDRDKGKDEYLVLIKAQDQATNVSSQLRAYCQIKVSIEDVNDNKPEFSPSEYLKSIASPAKSDNSILTVFASDFDSPINANITYSLRGGDHQYFTVEQSGDLYVTKDLPDRDDKTFHFQVIASDNARHEKELEGKASVTITIATEAPAPQLVDTGQCNHERQPENVPLGTVLFVCCVTVEGVDFALPRIVHVFKNQLSDYLFTDVLEENVLLTKLGRKKRKNEYCLSIGVQKMLDYDTFLTSKTAVTVSKDSSKTKTYDLVLGFKDKHSLTSMNPVRTLKLTITDVNDNIPTFPDPLSNQLAGTIMENLDASEAAKNPIFPPKPTDDDTIKEFRTVTYSIRSGSGKDKLFNIDPDSGAITPRQKFDREVQPFFDLVIDAKDGAKGSFRQGPNIGTVNIRIEIGDDNDNKPEFIGAPYTATVTENALAATAILTVKANDKDSKSRLTYTVLSKEQSNKSIPFQANALSGTISVAGAIDYETQSVYHLQVNVSDGPNFKLADLTVEVRDENDNDPSFIGGPIFTVNVEEEKEDNYPVPLLKVNATDKDSGTNAGPIIYKLLGQGVNEGIFSINNITGQIMQKKKVDRDEPNGHAVWKMIIQAIDENAKGRVGTAEFHVNVRDINDNPPIGDHQDGYLQENKDPGTRIMDVKFRDLDESGTLNSKLKYRLVTNEIDDKGKKMFKINPTTGELSSLKTFDFEGVPRTTEYNLIIEAQDSGSSPLTGQVGVTVHIVDVNDNPPSFGKDRYQINVPETTEIGTIITPNPISITDKDKEAAENVVFRISSDKDGLGMKYFKVEAGQGRHVQFRLRRKLDYEDLILRGINHKIQIDLEVHDGLYKAYTKVVFNVEDRDDTKPQLSTDRSTYTIHEDTSIGTVVFIVASKDPDSNNQLPEYSIDRSTDPDRRFEILQDGSVKVAQNLDYEQQQNYSLRLVGTDPKGNQGEITVKVFLEDVNDNAPTVISAPDPCVIMEQEDSDTVDTSTLRCTFEGNDTDTAANGAPFKFTLDVNNYAFKDKFRLELSEDLSTIKLYSKVKFDREEKASYAIPVQIEDNGVPKLSAQRNLIIQIGDINDHPSKDGTTNIFMYSYETVRRTEIGSVYVEDEDSDDLADKTFKWPDNGQRPSNFEVDDKGTITVNANTPAGVYQFKIDMYDSTWKNTVTGTVIVFIEDVTELAFKRSGSIRLRGITAKDFIKGGSDSSPYQRMKVFLASKTAVPEKNVQIFSLMDRLPIIEDTEQKAILDIRFSAHNSPAFPAAQMNGLIELYRKEFMLDLFHEDVSKYDLLMVNIDECLIETCDKKGCSTKLTSKPDATVVDAGSFVVAGVTTETTKQCGCPVPETPNKCAIDTCLNNGICHTIKTDQFFCECRVNSGQYNNLKGARCEGMARSFYGNGYAWFEPLNSCSDQSLSLEFRPEAEDGVIFYSGPMSNISYPANIKNGPTNDFLAIMLVGGIVKIKYTTGIKETEAIINARSSLNDGMWHRIDIYRERYTFVAELDGCRTGEPADYTDCRTRVVQTSKVFEVINTNSPIQLGGLAGDATKYPASLSTKKGFNGCIRDVMVNGELLDLETVAYSKESEGGGCQSSIKADCTIGGKSCVNGECVGKTYLQNTNPCLCDPGWFGMLCDKKAPWFEFESGSVSIIDLQFQLNQLAGIMQLLMVPHSDSGSLQYLKTEENDDLNVGVANYKASYEYKYGELDTTKGSLILGETMSNDVPYWIKVQRMPGKNVLSMDNLVNGGYYAMDESTDSLPMAAIKPPQKLSDRQQILIGAKDSAASDNDFRGCIAEYRYDMNFIPVSNSSLFNSIDKISTIISTDNIQPGCSFIKTCAQLGLSYCSSPFVCVDFWKGPFCTCPIGYLAKLGPDGTLSSCLQESRYRELGITNSALIAILVSILALMILVLFLLVWVRRRRPRKEPFAAEEYSQTLGHGYEEGGGEGDQKHYDLGPLRKPVLPPDSDRPSGRPQLPPGGTNSLLARPPPDNGDLKDVIGDRLADCDGDPHAPPYDELRIWADEGDGISSVGSLSSLGSTDSDDVDWDRQLDRWGPKFGKLKGMYQGQDL